MKILRSESSKVTFSEKKEQRTALQLRLKLIMYKVKYMMKLYILDNGFDCCKMRLEYSSGVIMSKFSS